MKGLFTTTLLGLLIVFGCARTERVRYAAPVELKHASGEMYDVLRSLADPKDLVLAVEDCVALGKRGLLAWVSTGSPTGGAVIGVFDQHGRLTTWVRTEALVACRPVVIRGVGECVLYIEYGTGTGARVDTLHLARVANLSEQVWQHDVNVWEAGVEDRNVGRRVDSFAMLSDLDGDGRDEIVNVDASRFGLEPVPMLLSSPIASVRAFRFDDRVGSFVPHGVAPPLLYPPPHVAEETLEQAHASGLDYEGQLVLARQGDRDAVAQLLCFSTQADAAGAIGHGITLVELMEAIGDHSFAACVRVQTSDVKRTVKQCLEASEAYIQPPPARPLREDYPSTFSSLP